MPGDAVQLSGVPSAGGTPEAVPSVDGTPGAVAVSRLRSDAVQFVAEASGPVSGPPRRRFQRR
ncbi:hypothetical protein ACE1SV_71710 [Streptomyces sennicomposti]